MAWTIGRRFAGGLTSGAFMKASRIIPTLALVVGLAGSVTACGEPEELLVFAAASLADALDEIEEAFEKQTQIRVAVSYGGSQSLAQQIAGGAPAGVFVSAGEFPIDFLADRGLLESPAVHLLTTRLVVAVRSPGEIQLDSMEQLNTAQVGRVAVAAPDLAPAGGYARESLMSLGIWEDLQAKLVFGPDVRATLAYVESGNADVAIVYATDAAAAPTIAAFDIVPSGSYGPIVYPVVIVKDTTNKTDANDFVDFLQGAAASQIFREYGFEPVE